MTTNITLLALNLLISERPSHRSNFANRIAELLKECKAASEQEKSNFLFAAAKCVENPNCDSRAFFYEQAQYFHEKINGVQSNLSTAA